MLSKSKWIKHPLQALPQMAITGSVPLRRCACLEACCSTIAETTHDPNRLHSSSGLRHQILVWLPPMAMAVSWWLPFHCRMNWNHHYLASMLSRMKWLGSLTFVDRFISLHKNILLFWTTWLAWASTLMNKSKSCLLHAILSRHWVSVSIISASLSCDSWICIVMESNSIPKKVSLGAGPWVFDGASNRPACAQVSCIMAMFWWHSSEWGPPTVKSRSCDKLPRRHLGTPLSRIEHLRLLKKRRAEVKAKQ